MTNPVVSAAALFEGRLCLEMCKGLRDFLHPRKMTNRSKLLTFFSLVHSSQALLERGQSAV